MKKNKLNRLNLLLFVCILISSALSWSQTISQKQVDIRLRNAVDFRNGFLPSFNGEKWGIMDSNNIIVIDHLYDELIYGGRSITVGYIGSEAHIISEDCVIHRKTDTNFVYYSDEASRLIIEDMDRKIVINYINGQYSEHIEHKNQSDSNQSQLMFKRPSIKSEKLDLDKNYISSLQVLARNETKSLILRYTNGALDSITNISKYKIANEHHIVYNLDKEKGSKVYDVRTHRIQEFRKAKVIAVREIGDQTYLTIEKAKSIQVIDSKRKKIIEIDETDLIQINYGDLICLWSTTNGSAKVLFNLKKKEILEEKPILFDLRFQNLIRVKTKDSLTRLYDYYGTLIYNSKLEPINIMTTEFMGHNYFTIQTTSNNYLTSDSGKNLLASTDQIKLKLPCIFVKSSDSTKYYYLHDFEEEVIAVNGTQLKWISPYLASAQQESGMWYLIRSRGKDNSEYLYQTIDFVPISYDKNQVIVKCKNGSDFDYYTGMGLKLNLNGNYFFYRAHPMFRNYPDLNNGYKMPRSLLLTDDKWNFQGYINESYKLFFWNSSYPIVMTNEYGKYFFVIDSKHEYYYIRYGEKGPKTGSKLK